MALGNKKYLDPSGVLQSVLDDQGDQVAIGDEKDISEYNQVLLTRIQDAFNWKRQREEEAKNPKSDVVMQPSRVEPADDSQIINTSNTHGLE